LTTPPLTPQLSRFLQDLLTKCDGKPALALALAFAELQTDEETLLSLSEDFSLQHE